MMNVCRLLDSLDRPTMHLHRVGGMAKRRPIDFETCLGDQLIMQFRDLGFTELPWFMMDDAAPDTST